MVFSFIPKPRTLLSLAELTATVSASKLVTGESLLCTLFGKVCVLKAISPSAVSRKIDHVFGENYDYYELDLANNRILAFDNLSCVIRNVGGTWGFINDVGHEPRRCASVSQTADSVVITYGKTYTKVLSLVVNGDETYARAGVQFGPSVGLADATLLAGVSGGFSASFTETSGTMIKTFGGQFDSVSSVSMQLDGEIRIFHDTILHSFPFIQSFNGLRPQITTASSSSVIFKMLNASGAVVTDPTQISFYLLRSGTMAIANSKLYIPNSNFWINGVMMTEFK